MYFDADNRSLAVRILYDGSDAAGRTSTLRQIVGQFSAVRVAALVSSPEALTRHFDWVELKAGVVEGYPLRCQLVSARGPFGCAERRVELLKRADAIVYVCDSAEEAVRHRVQEGIRLLESALARIDRSHIPIIVQANKQDLPSARRASEIAEMLGFQEKRVHGANASTGAGVRTTLLAAIHAAATQLRDVLRDRGIDAISKEVETPESLYENLRDLPEVSVGVQEQGGVPEAPVTKPILESERPTAPPPPPYESIVGAWRS